MNDCQSNCPGAVAGLFFNLKSNNSANETHSPFFMHLNGMKAISESVFFVQPSSGFQISKSSRFRRNQINDMIQKYIRLQLND